MSECPECGKFTRQEWSDGYPATMDSPEEPAGYECLWCGHWYGSKWDRIAVAADHRNDDEWENEE